MNYSHHFNLPELQYFIFLASFQIFNMSSSIPNRASSSAAPRAVKNSKGTRNDIGWKHGVSVDGGTRKIKCNYCGKVILGGVYRLKHHLGHTNINVCACEHVPDDVKVQMWELCKDLQVKLNKKTKDDDADVLRGKRPVEEDDKATPANVFKKRGMSTQATINSIFKKNLREEACLEIASTASFTISEDLDGEAQNEEHEVAEDEVEIHNLDDEFEGNEDVMEDMGFDENVLKDLLN
jgi:hypothetical protein